MTEPKRITATATNRRTGVSRSLWTIGDRHIVTSHAPGERFTLAFHADASGKVTSWDEIAAGAGHQAAARAAAAELDPLAKFWAESASASVLGR